MNTILRQAQSILKTKSPYVYHQLKRANNFRYLNQSTSLEKIKYYGLGLSVPADHKLLSLVTEQPLREKGLQSAAAAIFGKHAGSIYVDVGANIGDTAAAVRSVSSCPMVLIEPSSVFYPILCRNVPAVGGPIETLNSFFVTSGDADQGFELIHTAGTAQPHRVRKRDETTNVSLDDLSSSRIGLFKIDTDGYDLPLLESYMDRFAARAINLFFELEIRSHNDVDRWLSCMRGYLSKGYTDFLVWDDPGHFMCSATSLELLEQLLRWQQSYMDGSSQEPSRISNFDVLALHGDDRDLTPQIIQRSQGR